MQTIRDDDLKIIFETSYLLIEKLWKTVRYCEKSVRYLSKSITNFPKIICLQCSSGLEKYMYYPQRNVCRKVIKLSPSIEKEPTMKKNILWKCSKTLIVFFTSKSYEKAFKNSSFKISFNYK